MMSGPEQKARFQEALSMWKSLRADFPNEDEIPRAINWTEQRLAELDGRARPSQAVTGGPSTRDPVDASEREALMKLAGQQVAVKGRVQEVVMGRSRSGLTYVNFNRNFNAFHALIHRNSLPRFQAIYGEKLEKLLGSEIVMTGVIDIYRDIPQLLLNQPAQLKVTDDAGSKATGGAITEIYTSDTIKMREYSGRRVAVTGRIRDVTLSPEREMTFINFKTAITGKGPNDRCVAIVRGMHTDKFARAFGSDLNSFFKDKMIRITGQLYLYKDQPNMEVTEPSQIEIID
jgi:DNA/RNA endonuclease YhcR with UshA esterase domain